MQPTLAIVPKTARRSTYKIGATLMATQNTRTRRSTNLKPGFIRRDVVGDTKVNQEIDTKAPIRDQFNTVLGNELAALLWYMTKPRNYEVTFGWSVQQRRDAYRYMRQLTHGTDAAILGDTSALEPEEIESLLDSRLDYSSLTEEQINAIRTIFQVLCAFEESRMLTRSWRDSMRKMQYQSIILPGMETDWYTDGYEQILDLIKAGGADIRNISHASRFLAGWRKATFRIKTAKKVTTDKVMVDV